VSEAYPDDSPGRLRTAVGNLDRFLNQMSIGDLVVTTDGSKVYVGVVTSDATLVATKDRGSERRRDVEWANPQDPIIRDELSAGAFSKLRTLLTVSEVSADRAEYEERSGLSVVEPTEGVPKPERIHLAPPDEEFAKQLLLPREWLVDLVELLDEKRQVIFYGPPGTGKTFLAQRLASYLTEGGGLFFLVQFHPSYAYEVNRPGIPGGSIPWKRGWSHGEEGDIEAVSV